MTTATPSAGQAQKAAAKAFANKWQGIGDEKQHTQTFWLELLAKVYGVAQPFGFSSSTKIPPSRSRSKFSYPTVCIVM